LLSTHRGLFATHYHRLADEHAADAAVAIRHMGCAVDAGGADGMPETVTFLYTLADGACPKSYGAAPLLGAAAPALSAVQPRMSRVQEFAGIWPMLLSKDGILELNCH